MIVWHITVPKLVSFWYSSNSYNSALVWCAFTEHIHMWRQTQKKALTYNTKTIKSGFHLQNLSYRYHKKKLLLVAKGIKGAMFKTP